ncbi:MAG: aromatic amino acid lyase, partial [Mucilaginibacter sp.]
NSFEVLAIHLMTILQAIDYLECEDRLSTISRELYQTVRKIFPKFIEDQPKYKDLERVKNFLESADHLNIFAK